MVMLWPAVPSSSYRPANSTLKTQNSELPQGNYQTISLTLTPAGIWMLALVGVISATPVLL